MNKTFLFITDDFGSLDQKKDTSIFMMEEAALKGIEVYQCEMENIYIDNKKIYADCCLIDVQKGFSKAADMKSRKIVEFSSVFMRKDPPVDESYINCLHLLGLAENNGAKVCNSPRAIKEFNEKIFALYFPDHIPKTLITSDIKKIIDFQNKHKTIIVKPLDGMGGTSIYKIDAIDKDAREILLNMTNGEKTKVVIQEFLEEIFEGDYRILIINGTPFTTTLARIPQNGNFKGNLAAGGKGVARDITPEQMEVALEVAERLKVEGINFAGIDMIGSKLTEVNITSPTCAREIFIQSGNNPIKEYIEGL